MRRQLKLTSNLTTPTKLKNYKTVTIPDGKNLLPDGLRRKQNFSHKILSHKFFLEKIAKYGFSTESIAMLESFLSNRKQCAKNGIECSNWVTMNHGVSQRTVLGPLIFIMYINDFPEKMKKREDVLQFADDTCISCHSKSDENLLCEINSVFENTDSYMRQNMLTLNRDKTEIVVFSKNG